MFYKKQKNMKNNYKNGAGKRIYYEAEGSNANKLKDSVAAGSRRTRSCQKPANKHSSLGMRVSSRLRAHNSRGKTFQLSQERSTRTSQAHVAGRRTHRRVWQHGVAISNDVLAVSSFRDDDAGYDSGSFYSINLPCLFDGREI